MVNEGRLPNFARALNEGSQASLLSSIPPLTPAAWVTFYMGTNPGRHGAVDFFRRVPGTYRLEPINAGTVMGTPLWSHASQLGKKVCVYNVPVTYPATPVNGIMISGMDAPSLDERAVYPRAFRDELLAEFPHYTIEPAADVRYLVEHSDDPVGEFTANLQAHLDLQVKVIRYLMKREDWDLFTAVIRSPDAFQHAFWQEAEKAIEGQPLDSGEQQKAEPVFRCYEQLDRELGEIWMQWGEDRNLVLMSDHGFGSLRREVCVNRLLADAGLLTFRKKGARRRTKEFVIDKVGHSISPNLRNTIKNRMRKNSRTGFLFVDALVADVDWSRTRVYSLGQFGCLFTNLQGREPMGTVRSEKERRATISAAKEALSEVIVPEDGLPLMSDFHSRDDTYHGPLLNSVPSGVVVMRNHSYRGIYSTRAELAQEEIYRKPCEDWKELSPTGCHRREGMLMMHGPDIRKANIGTVDMFDIMPTILTLMHLPLPQCCDGRVLQEVFTDSTQLLGENVSIMPDMKQNREAAAYTSEDEEIIRKRLGDLGYL